jgi:hypothetical protein
VFECSDPDVESDESGGRIGMIVLRVRLQVLHSRKEAMTPVLDLSRCGGGVVVVKGSCSSRIGLEDCYESIVVHEFKSPVDSVWQYYDDEMLEFKKADGPECAASLDEQNNRETKRERKRNSTMDGWMIYLIGRSLKKRSCRSIKDIGMTWDRGSIYGGRGSLRPPPHVRI